MHWYVRRYQNEDGSYTEAGRRRYKKGEKMIVEKNDRAIVRGVKHDYNTMTDSQFAAKYKVSKNRYRKRVNRYGSDLNNSPLYRFGKWYAKRQGYKYSPEQELRMIAKNDKQVNKYRSKEMHSKKLNGALIKSSSYNKGKNMVQLVVNEHGEDIYVNYDPVTDTYTIGSDKIKTY